MPQVTVQGTVYQYEDPFEGCEGNHPNAITGAISLALRDGGSAGASLVFCETRKHVAKTYFNVAEGNTISARIEAK